MDDRILAAAEIIGGPDGGPFLQFMSDAYYGKARRDAQGAAAAAVAMAEKIGLIRKNSPDVCFTSPGFLVGNVAKEYCHYVENGRTTAPPKPSRDMIAGRDVLDLGCSFGRTLWEFQRDARSAVGIEMQQEYIVLGKALSALEKVEAPKIIAANGENLDQHFGPGSLDVIFTRLVLSYLHVIPVLEKMIAALRPGGLLWIQVDSPKVLPEHLLERNGSLRRKGWTLLALLNLPVCILTGKQISVAAPGRMHARHQPAFLPLWWWRKTLRNYGLRDFKVYPAPSLVFSASK
jgi:SAM-dependent methyltransferase